MHGLHFWCFDNERNFGKAEIVEDIRECCRADVAFTDVFVPVHSALVGQILRR